MSQTSGTLPRQDETFLVDRPTQTGQATLSGVSRERLIKEQAELHAAMAKIYDYAAEIELLIHRVQLKSPDYTPLDAVAHVINNWSIFRTASWGALQQLAVMEHILGS